MSMKFMMEGLVIFVLIGMLCAIPCGVYGVSVSCMMAYEEGGAPAVFSSLECPQWVLSAGYSENSTRNCQFAMLQGHREYQEDRVTCNLDMKLLFSGEGTPEETTVGIAAIFDGHGGDEASEMASRKFLDYFSMHAVFTAYKRALPSNNENHETNKVERMDHHSLLPILEEALLRTIQDIDSEFSKEALDKGYISGSTATIALLVNGQFLVANVGDSKALLCSEKTASHHDTEGTSSGEVYIEELTRDHHPDREDEKARIQSAGGFVSERGIPRVNGILAVSRAIGDVYLKRYGVTADPEVTGWRAFTPENSYLVVASDGIFETLTTKNVCDLVHDKASRFSSEHVSSSSLADWIIRHAFRRGSTDNLSAIVIADLHNCKEGGCNRERKRTT
ncbi:Serine/threonine protein phosphatase [Handroanthus impetiginosus]|uniref:protein-serine/threonine phosphatase n=1 Tax=Handroanthus impetiginosus TaxID=429701 RepID=A0A2G9FZX9_9LAMI|nr:Serine/threonine protein phosphatase [Handroanthus impetiginosus]